MRKPFKWTQNVYKFCLHSAERLCCVGFGHCESNKANGFISYILLNFKFKSNTLSDLEYPVVLKKTETRH